MLPDEIEKVEGGANFRQVVGFPVFGVAQPSPDGMKNILEKVKASGDDKTNKEPNVQPIIIRNLAVNLSQLCKSKVNFLYQSYG